MWEEETNLFPLVGRSQLYELAPNQEVTSLPVIADPLVKGCPRGFSKFSELHYDRSFTWRQEPLGLSPKIELDVESTMENAMINMLDHVSQDRVTQLDHMVMFEVDRLAGVSMKLTMSRLLKVYWITSMRVSVVKTDCSFFVLAQTDEDTSRCIPAFLQENAARKTRMTRDGPQFAIKNIALEKLTANTIAMPAYDASFFIISEQWAEIYRNI